MFGIDFDGTIADTNALKQRWIKTQLGIEIDKGTCDRTQCVPLIGEDAYERLSAYVYGLATMTLESMPNVRESLNALSEKGEVVVVTARNDATIPHARRWCLEQGFDRYITEIQHLGSKSKVDFCIETGLRYLIEDDVRHLAVPNAETLKRILLRVGEIDGEIPEEIVVCASWPEIVETIFAEEGWS